MAACTFAVGTADTGNSPNTSGNFSPASGDLLIALVQAGNTTDATSTLSSSIGGFTFTQIGSGVSYAAGTHMIYAFVSDALVSNTASQTVTWTEAADPAGGTVIFVYRVSGVTRTGLSAIKQSITNSGASGVTPNTVFSASALTGNPTLVLLGNGTSPAGVTPPTNWTENASGDLGYSNPTCGAECAHRDSGFTSTTITWASNSASGWAAIAVEVDTSTSSSAIVSLVLQQH
jgi:hypothetical protein